MIIQEILEKEPNILINHEQFLRLFSLVKFIPCQKKSLAIMNRFSQYNLQTDIRVMRSSSMKNKIKATLISLSKQVQNGLLQINRDADPFERLLVQAIIKQKSWEEIIEEHQLDKLFYVNRLRKYQIRDAWLLTLCLSRFPNRQGYSILSCIQSKSRCMFKRIYEQVKQLPYYSKKLQEWLKKPYQQLLRMYDDQEKVLLIAISTKATYIQTLRMLKDHFFFRKTVQQRQSNNSWICFLSLQCSGNDDMQYPYIHWNIKTVKWSLHKSYHKQNQVFNINRIKLAKILSTYQTFQPYFSNQIEVILLKAIKEKINWRITKENINSLFVNVVLSKDQRQKSLNFRKNTIQVENQASEEQLEEEFYDYERQDQQDGDDQNQRRSVSDTLSLSNPQTKDNLEEESNRQSQSEKDKGIKVHTNQTDNISINRKSAIKSNPFDLNKQQSFVLYLLEKVRHYLVQIEEEYFRNVPNSSLLLYPHKNKPEMTSIAYEKIRQYREFSERIAGIDDEQIKYLLHTLLIATASRQRPSLNIMKTIQAGIELQDMSTQFMKGYNKIVQQLGLSTHPLVGFEDKTSKKIKKEL